LTKKIHYYRPQRTSPQSLEAIFVAREHILQEILGRLEQWRPGASRQHFLLIGPRGIGKTHVLSLVAHRISLSPRLNRLWLPLVFPEEAYRITKISDLLLQALGILCEETKDKEVTALYNQVRCDDDDVRVTDLVLDGFRKFSRQKGIGFLFLIENVNRILEQQIKDKSQVHLLRKILIEEEWIVTLCTSPTYLDAVVKEDEPLFEFFQVRFLAELSSAEQLEMLRKLAAHENNQAFRDYLQKYRSRLQALYHFTGGNPRLTIMLYDLVSYQAITDVQEELDGLLNEITPFYQGRMKDIGEQEGKIIETMALLAEGCTPTELAREARMEAKLVRAYLGRLEKAGYVRREERKEKKTVYIIPERLFRIWHQMNHSRASRGLISYLLEFFSTWYQTKEERDETWNDILGKMKAAADGDDERHENLSEYMNYIIAVSEGSERFEREFDMLRGVSLPKGMAVVEEELMRLDALYGTDWNYYIQKGYFYAKDLNRPDEALNAFHEASHLNPKDVIPLFNQALTLELLERKKEAKELYSKTAALILNQAGTNRIDSAETFDALLTVLRDSQNKQAVRIASYILGNCGDHKIAESIIRILEGSSDHWRCQYCITATGFLKYQPAVPVLLKYLENSRNNIRGSAATALGNIGSEKAVDSLIQALSDEARDVRGSAATALGNIGSEKAVDSLIMALSDKARDVRGSAASALGKIGSEKAVDSLIKALSDEARDVRGSAGIALLRIAAEAPVSNLEQVIDQIFRHLKETEPQAVTYILRFFLRGTFHFADVKIIHSALDSAKTYFNPDESFYSPYENALEYLESAKNTAILDRQHPEMRDAIQLLVNLFEEKTKDRPHPQKALRVT
jgi:HEAT repeat protein/DNA-binding transcriptional ArsR family regulator